MPPRLYRQSISSNSSVTDSYLPTPVTHRTCMSAAVKRYRYLRKLCNINQMDFEFACWQMTYLFISPQKVYRNFQYRKETKSQFARDDPAFLLLLLSFLVVSSVGFTLTLNVGVLAFVKLLLYFIFIDCITTGIIIATVLWFATNKFMIKPSCKGQDVEWGYAFDVHLNAFCPLLVISHIVQLIFYNSLVLVMDPTQLFPRLFANTMWIVAFGYYFYITFLGYRQLQILENTRVFLTPIPVMLLFYLVSLIIGWNVSQHVQDFYHYRVL